MCRSSTRRRATPSKVLCAKSRTQGACAVATRQYRIVLSQSSTDEAVRRSLEFCGINAGVPCAIIAVDNMFTVPVPMTMKVVRFFGPQSHPAFPRKHATRSAKNWPKAPEDGVRVQSVTAAVRRRGPGRERSGCNFGRCRGLPDARSKLRRCCAQYFYGGAKIAHDPKVEAGFRTRSCAC